MIVGRSADRAPAPGEWRAIDWSSHEHRTTVSGRVVNHVDVGPDRTPLVLVHGHGATWQYWLPMIPPLAQDRRVIAVDLPGFGHSARLPRDDATMDRLVDSVIGVTARLGISTFDLVGHSMGSIVAVETAVAHPRAVRSLTLAGGPAASMIRMFQHPLRTARRQPGLAGVVVSDMLGAGLPFPSSVLDIVAAHRRTRRAALKPYVADPDVVPADLARELMRGVGAPGYFQVPRHARAYTPADYEDIACPTMLVNGTADRFVPTADVDEFLARHPCPAHVLPAGHLVTVERPDECVRLIREHTAP